MFCFKERRGSRVLSLSLSLERYLQNRRCSSIVNRFDLDLIVVFQLIQLSRVRVDQGEIEKGLVAGLVMIGLDCNRTVLRCHHRVDIVPRVDDERNVSPLLSVVTVTDLICINSPRSNLVNKGQTVSKDNE